LPITIDWTRSPPLISIGEARKRRAIRFGLPEGWREAYSLTISTLTRAVLSASSDSIQA
jgi:hypothetical protein